LCISLALMFIYWRYKPIIAILSGLQIYRAESVTILSCIS